MPPAIPMRDLPAQEPVPHLRVPSARCETGSPYDKWTPLKCVCMAGLFVAAFGVTLIAMVLQ